MVCLKSFCFHYSLSALAIEIWGHPFSTFAKYSEKLIFLTLCAYQGVRNVIFLENFVCVLNG